MPCYEVNLVSIELKQENLELIIKTLKELKLFRYISQENIETYIGKFDLSTKTANIDSRYLQQFNQFKQQYSKNAIMLAAKKNKWIVKEKSKNKFVANKW